MPGIYFADDGFKRRGFGVCDVLACTADENALERRAIVQLPGKPHEPLVIDEGDLGAGIVKPIFELRPGPPGIEQSRDAAGKHATEERRGPFRQVAHGNGDAIALLHAGALQRFGDGERGTRERFVARAIVATDQEGFAAVRAAQQKKLAQGRRRVFPHARTHAANIALLDFKQRTRSGQRGIGLRQRNDRKVLRQHHGLLYAAAVAIR